MATDASNTRHVLLCHVEDGYYAIDDLCTHEDFSLHLGCLKGDQVECSLHGARYNVKTGAPEAEPGEIPLNTYPVTIEDDLIFIDVSSITKA